VIGRHRGIALAAVLALAGCQESAAPAKPLAVATIYPLWELARQVAGDRAEVVSLVPPGVEPHDWEPAPRDVSLLQRANVVVHTGTGLDAWVVRLLAALPASTTVVNGARGLSLLPQGASVDPHVWLDPALARAPGQSVYRENATALAARLDALDEAFAAGLRDCARREVVTSHAAFAYLTRRYRLTQVAIMGSAPEAEPSPADLAAIVQTARRLRVTHVFFEPLVSPRLAQTLAREIGATTLALDPIEGVSREQAAAGAGYVELMQANLAALRLGLGCR